MNIKHVKSLLFNLSGAGFLPLIFKFFFKYDPDHQEYVSIHEKKVQIVIENSSVSPQTSARSQYMFQIKILVKIKVFEVQGDQFNIVLCFLYLVKSGLSSVHVYSNVHWTINFLQGTRRTRSWISGRAVQDKLKE